MTSLAEQLAALRMSVENSNVPSTPIRAPLGPNMMPPSQPLGVNPLAHLLPPPPPPPAQLISSSSGAIIPMLKKNGKYILLGLVIILGFYLYKKRQKLASLVPNKLQQSVPQQNPYGGTYPGMPPRPQQQPQQPPQQQQQQQQGLRKTAPQNPAAVDPNFTAL